MITKLFKVLFLIILMVVPLTGCSEVFTSYEDKLYSEKTILGSEPTSTKASNMLTRKDAIKKALDVFNKGLGVNINRSDFTEDIKLVKNDIDDSLQWHITWDKDYGKIFYSCTLDSSTEEIIELIQVNNSNSNSNNNTTSKLSISEITDLINPLLTKLGIDIDNYEIKLPKETNSKTMKIELYNKKKAAKEYTIYINSFNKTVTNFQKLYNK